MPGWSQRILLDTIVSRICHIWLHWLRSPRSVLPRMSHPTSSISAISSTIGMEWIIIHQKRTLAAGFDSCTGTWCTIVPIRCKWQWRSETYDTRYQRSAQCDHSMVSLCLRRKSNRAIIFSKVIPSQPGPTTNGVHLSSSETLSNFAYA